jgi:Fic family protein
MPEKNQKIPGTYKKHVYGDGKEYLSFSPLLINKPYRWASDKIALQLEEAGRMLGELNAYSVLVPNVDFFVQMHIIKEATKSSRIEGTRTSIEDIVLPEAEVKPDKRDDWEEVRNYIKAINFSIEKLGKLPLSMRLINEAHAILLSGVRGEDKQPGEIRQKQNWIGGGTKISEATFVPPYHTELPELLSDLQKFWHDNSTMIPHLIKIALGHYQFETIHPFSDGNGRIGRLLITLQLIDYKILKKPTLYISDYFEKNRMEYYDSLTRVRASGNVEQWIKFFLAAVISTAENAKKTLENIIAQKDKYEKRIMAFGRRAELGHKLLVHLYSEPSITIQKAKDVLGVSFNTADSVIKLFVQKEMLKEISGFSRNKVFILHEYVDLFGK